MNLFARFTLRQREALACAFFIAPAVIGFVLFWLLPLLVSAYLSFTNYAMAGWPKFVGVENYRTLLNDDLWQHAVRVTVLYAISVVPLWLLSSLALALIMNQPLGGVGLFRTIYYLPAVLSGVATALLWKWLFNVRYGLINSLLKGVGVQGPNWVGDEQWVLPSLIFMSLWGMGWYLPIWLGGLQSIPTDLYEAANIDGASWWAKLRNVTLPMLSPVILYNLMMNLVWALQFFTESMVMTGGASQPVQMAARSYVLYLYQTGIGYLRMGQATAMAWLLFLATLLLTFTVFKSSLFWVYYEGERRDA
ncbi:MAG: sugar ABC transporter permease [Chloroflexota bacterium]|nr:sugar ABC transporter permease [Chloroflexota bacterium]